MKPKKPKTDLSALEDGRKWYIEVDCKSVAESIAVAVLLKMHGHEKFMLMERKAKK
jgi:hypothetical protein